MIVSNLQAEPNHDEQTLLSETRGLLDGLHEPATERLHLHIAPPAVVSRAPLRRRIRPLKGPRPSRFQQCLAVGEAVVEPEGNSDRGYRRAKRVMDLAGALVLLTILAPVLATIYVVLWIATRGNPIFRQTRLGYLGRPFTMYKFRTMALDATRRQAEVANEKDGPIFKNRRDPRITRLGRLLRMTSLDETPQLFNVLLGHMALVGPRPPIGAEVAKYEPWQRRRLAVMPGLTCLWQVSGRSEIGFRDWVRMDLWYLRHQSLRVDLRLLVKTPWSVLTGRGAY